MGGKYQIEKDVIKSLIRESLNTKNYLHIMDDSEDYEEFEVNLQDKKMQDKIDNSDDDELFAGDYESESEYDIHS